MSAGPYYNLIEAVVKNAIICVAPILSGLKDENDVTYAPPIPLRSVFSPADAVFSEVVVTYRPGQISFTGGKNQLIFDDKTGIYYYGFHAPDSRLLFTVKARTDAERHYIIDALLGGIVADFSLDPSGNAVEGSVLDNLGFCGIVATGFDAADFPEPDLSEPRVEGQVYQATLSLMCDVWHQWNVTPARAVGGIQIQPVVINDPSSQLPGQVSTTTIVIH